MAYNKKNRLKRIIDIQTIYLKWQKVGLNNRVIWEQHIYPIYKISERCFYNYLGENAKKELKDILAAEKQQTALQFEE